MTLTGREASVNAAWIEIKNGNWQTGNKIGSQNKTTMWKPNIESRKVFIHESLFDIKVFENECIDYP